MYIYVDVYLEVKGDKVKTLKGTHRSSFSAVITERVDEVLPSSFPFTFQQQWSELA